MNILNILNILNINQKKLTRFEKVLGRLKRASESSYFIGFFWGLICAIKAGWDKATGHKGGGGGGSPKKSSGGGHGGGHH